MAFYQSVRPVWTRALADALLAALSARPAAALFAATVHVHLFVNNISPNKDTAIGDFVEATFVGYAVPSLGVLVGPVSLTNAAEALMQDVNFIGASIVPPGETTYGYYLTDNTDAVLYLSESFTQPVPFSGVGDFLDLKIVIPQPTLLSTQ